MQNPKYFLMKIFFRWYKIEKNFLKNYEKKIYIKCLNFDCLEDKMFGKLFVFNIVLYFDKSKVSLWYIYIYILCKLAKFILRKINNILSSWKYT